MNHLVMAAVSDLFFASKIRATAEYLGIEVRFLRSVEALAESAREKKPDLVLVDLQSTNLDAIELAKTFQADAELQTTPLLGFYSHVQTELQEKAKLAGYKQVMPRSAFSSRLAEILSGDIR